MSFTVKEMKSSREAASQVSLLVSSEEALRYMRLIPHKGFLKSLRKNWRVNENGQVTIQSICWLFCWATRFMQQSLRQDIRPFIRVVCSGGTTRIGKDMALREAQGPN